MAYPYWTDTRGRRVSRQLRRAWRIEDRRTEEQLPSPFLPEEAAAYDAWRRRALKTEARELMGDAVKSARLALPEEYGRLRNRFPRLVGALRGKAFNARRHLEVAGRAGEPAGWATSVPVESGADPPLRRGQSPSRRSRAARTRAGGMEMSRSTPVMGRCVGGEISSGVPATR